MQAVKADDSRYFSDLVALGFPLYEEDSRGYFAAFFIASIKGDGVFLEAFKALVRVNFDVSYPTSRSLTFVSCMCQSDRITVQKMQALLNTQPQITPEMVSQLI